MSCAAVRVCGQRRASPPGWGQGGIRRSLTLVTSLVNIVLELHRSFRVEGRAWRSARHQAARVGDGRGHAAFRTQLSGPPHAAKHLADGLAIRTVSLFEDCNRELPQWMRAVMACGWQLANDAFLRN